MLNQCPKIGEAAGYTLLEQQVCCYLTERILVYVFLSSQYIHDSKFYLSYLW